MRACSPQVQPSGGRQMMHCEVSGCVLHHVMLRGPTSVRGSPMGSTAIVPMLEQNANADSVRDTLLVTQLIPPPSDDSMPPAFISGVWERPCAQ